MLLKILKNKINVMRSCNRKNTSIGFCGYYANKNYIDSVHNLIFITKKSYDVNRFEQYKMNYKCINIYKNKIFNIKGIERNKLSIGFLTYIYLKYVYKNSKIYLIGFTNIFNSKNDFYHKVHNYKLETDYFNKDIINNKLIKINTLDELTNELTNETSNET